MLKEVDRKNGQEDLSKDVLPSILVSLDWWALVSLEESRAMVYAMSAEEIDSLIDEGGLSIDEDIIWRQEDRYLVFRVPVNNDKNLTLDLVGSKNVNVFRYSFALVLNKSLRIRGYCPFRTHVNQHPTREVIQGKHKHKWTDECQDTWAYAPDDIPTSDIEDALRHFMDECNIAFDGEYCQPPPAQLPMEID